MVAYQSAEPKFGPAIANTMLLTTLSCSTSLPGTWPATSETRSSTGACCLEPTQLRRYGIALLAIIAVTTIGFLQRIVGTVDLSLSQWSVCIGLAATLVVIEELIKLVLRRREPAQGAPRHAVAVS